MKLFRGFKLSILMGLGFLISNACSSTPKVADNPNDIRLIAKDAYIYGYPLILTDLTKNTSTGVARPTGTGMKVKAPVNQFANFRGFPDASTADAVNPNADTLYSTAWLDLSQGPQIITIPPTGDRYFSASMMDAWTNVFFSAGPRTTGNQMKNFAIVGPGWKGDIPSGVEVVQAPTNTVWVVGRTAVKNPNDFKGAHYIQDRLMITPITRWGKPYKPATVAVNKNIDRRTPAHRQIITMTAEDYFSRLAELMKTNPPLSYDGRIIRDLSRIGIKPGESFDPSKLSPEARIALSDGVLEGSAEISTGAKNLEGEVVDNWTYLRNQGDYGTNYKTRAIMANSGLGANLDADAMYVRATVDSQGQPLNGENPYVIHFTKENLPPVNGFWSLAVYNSKQGFVKNPIKRYTLGSHNNLVYGDDGSLNIVVQNKSPGRPLQANWLPAPKGDFNLVMRLYWPKESAIKGAWHMPAVQKSTEPVLIQKAAWVDELMLLN
jgi:hypothetical protein